MTDRSYGQYCPIAVALDVVGDRWTLLVVRDLLSGERRYTDLQRGLPGVSPNLLAERLRILADHGLVERRELDPPAASTVYRLTPAGRRLAPVIGALARFGSDHVPEPAADQAIRPGMVVNALLRPFFDPDAGDAEGDRYRLVLDDTGYDLEVTDGRLRVTRREPARTGDEESDSDVAVDLVVTAPAAVLVRARQGAVDLTDPPASLLVSGTEDAWERFLAVFGLDHAPVGPTDVDATAIPRTQETT